MGKMLIERDGNHWCTYLEPTKDFSDGSKNTNNCRNDRCFLFFVHLNLPFCGNGEAQKLLPSGLSLFGLSAVHAIGTYKIELILSRGIITKVKITKWVIIIKLNYPKLKIDFIPAMDQPDVESIG